MIITDSAAWNYRYHHCCLAGYHIFKKNSLKNIAWITGLSDVLCYVLSKLKVLPLDFRTFSYTFNNFRGLHWISLIFFRLDKSFPSFNRYIIWIFAQSQVDGQRVKNSPWELKKSLLSINSIFLEWVLKTSSLLNSSRATSIVPCRSGCVSSILSRTSYHCLNTF